MSRAKSLYNGSVDAKLLEQALDASSSDPFHGYLRYLIFLDGIVPMFLTFKTQRYSVYRLLA